MIFISLFEKDRFHSITFVHVFISAAAKDGSTVLCILRRVTRVGLHIFGISGGEKTLASRDLKM